MNKKIISVLGLFLLLFTTANLLPAQSQPLPKKVALSLKKGKSYAVARRILSANGWKPINNYRNIPEFNKDHYVVKKLHYYEMEDCSGTGMGFCNFLFKNGKGKILTVTTANNEDGMKPTIAGYDIR